jgi:hypothetical protein
VFIFGQPSFFNIASVARDLPLHRVPHILSAALFASLMLALRQRR